MINGGGMKERIADLEERRGRALEMGGERRIARQHERGKMTARERLAELVDEGSFLELGIHGSEYENPMLAADGVVTGMGKIDGRMCCIAVYDYTVLGGSIGLVGRRNDSGYYPKYQTLKMFNVHYPLKICTLKN